MPDGDGYERSPWFSRNWGRVLAPLERFFDVIYGSQLNPLYRSGPLAFLMLLMATGTGVFLLFYYRLSDPYSSVQHLQQQVFFGRWLRAWHRYLSDAAMVATVFHLLRMAVDGKTWGPRSLAWISGIFLMGATVLTAYTGLVMVWDRQGQWLAVAGARVADLLPIFSEPIGRAFGGAVAVTPSFFFMNMFLHVALPLGLVFLLWLHTSRLARSAWLPERKTAWTWVIALLILAIIWPAPLDAPADPLALGGAYGIDLFFAPWVPWSLSHAPIWTLIFALGLSAVAVTLPWWWKPAVSKQALASVNDEARCQGCTVCVTDCPFEAISMVPRTVGTGSAEVAFVDPSLCVSCGLCVASCDRLSIGPPDRSGAGQLAEMQTLARQHQATSVVVIHCRNSPLSSEFVRQASLSAVAIVPYGMDCVGSLHPFSVHALLNHFKGVFILSCAPETCQMREGAALARERLLQGRAPAHKVALEQSRLCLVQASAGDSFTVRHDWQVFLNQLGLAPVTQAARTRTGIFQWARLSVATALWLFLLAMMSAFSVGQTSQDSTLRLSWRLPGQAVRTCRDLTAAELASQAVHMRHKQDCSVRRLSYQLQLSLDGKVCLQLKVAPQGIHGDSPLNVNQDLAVAVGPHHFEVSFLPMDDPAQQGLHLVYRGDWQARPGRAGLLTLDQAGKSLEWLEKAR